MFCLKNPFLVRAFSALVSKLISRLLNFLIQGSQTQPARQTTGFVKFHGAKKLEF